MAKRDELRAELQALAGSLEEQRQQYQGRLEARKKDAAVELWDEAAAAKWKDTNAQYDAKKQELVELDRELEMVARSNEAREFLEQRGADQSARPHQDDELPGGSGQSYGDAGFNRDQARQHELNQRNLSLAFQAWSGHGAPGARSTEAQREACEALKFDPSRDEIQLRWSDTSCYRSLQRRMAQTHPDRRAELIDELLESRALSSGMGAGGGYLTVPASLIRAIEIAQIAWGSMLSAVETITTETGEEMSWPVADDTANQASYTDENVAVSTTSVDPGYESVKWRAHDLNSGFVRVSYRLFRDRFIDVEQHIGALIGERFGRKLNAEFTNGVAKIRGIVPRTPVGQTAANAASIVYADVVGLEHSVDPARRAGGQFMFHDAVLEALRLLVDSQNRPLWSSNLAAGAPDRFNGRTYILNQNMASAIATTAKTMLFGQVSNYKVRRVGPALRMRRLVERFAEFDQTAFISYQSVDGNLLRPNAAAACPVKLLQQA